MLTLSLPRAVGDALTPQGVSVPVCGANNRPEGDPPLREAEKGFRAAELEESRSMTTPTGGASWAPPPTGGKGPESVIARPVRTLVVAIRIPRPLLPVASVRGRTDGRVPSLQAGALYSLIPRPFPHPDP